MEEVAHTETTPDKGEEAYQVTLPITETTEHLLLIPPPLRRVDVRPLPEAMVAALDTYKCRTEGVCGQWAIEEDAQPLSGTMVATLTTFLSEYPRETSTTTTTAPDPLTPGLNVGSTFVVKEVKTYNVGLEGREIWTIEDVVSTQVTTVRTPVALLPHNTNPNAMLNAGVIPILECTINEWGYENSTFSLASLADGRKTALYGWGRYV